MKMFLFFVMTMIFAAPSFASLNNEANPHVAVVDLGSITTDGDVYGVYLPRKSRIVSVKLVNGADIAQDDSNYAVITLKLGTTVIATHSTKLTGGTSALTANTPASFSLSATDANLVPAANSYLKVNYDETGTYAMTSAKVYIVYYPL